MKLNSLIERGPEMPILGVRPSKYDQVRPKVDLLGNLNLINNLLSGYFKEGGSISKCHIMILHAPQITIKSFADLTVAQLSFRNVTWNTYMKRVCNSTKVG